LEYTQEEKYFKFTILISSPQNQQFDFVSSRAVKKPTTNQTNQQQKKTTNNIDEM
jgi:hypothetical protein